MDIKTFKSQLKEIGGVNRFGDPNLVLVHGSTARWHPNGPLKYTTGRECKEVEVTRGSFVCIEYQYRDIPQLCWVVEEWVPPELPKDHEKHRYCENEKGEQVDEFGPFPTPGKNRALLILEDREEKPINPDERILQILRAAKVHRNEVLKHGETEQATEEEIQAQVDEYLYKQATKQKELKDNMDAMIDDAIGPHKHRLHLANHTEGMHRDFRRGNTYDPNAYDRLKEEKPLVISNN